MIALEPFGISPVGMGSIKNKKERQNKNNTVRYII